MKNGFTIICLMILSLTIPANIYCQDTLVVKDSDAPLNEVIAGDTATDGSRLHEVYLLEQDGYYVLSGAINANDFDLTIIGEEGSGRKPIILTGTDDEGNAVTWGLIYCNADLTLKNLRIPLIDDLGTRGWNSFAAPSGENAVITVDNCVFDFNDGMAFSNDGKPGQSFYFTNNLFRSNGMVPWGGGWSGFTVIKKNSDVKMMYFENNTWLNCIAPTVVFENGNLENFWFNHNTIVNHAQFSIRSEYWIKALFMNNLFVNAHFAGEIDDLSNGQDPEALPYGVITVATPAEPWEGFPANDERILFFANNNNYVSPEIISFWETAESDFDTAGYDVADYEKGDLGFFNSRAAEMMADDETFPKFIWDDEHSLKTEDPMFPEFTFDFEQMITFARRLAGESGEASTWCTHPEGDARIPLDEDFYPLHYTNQNLLSGGYKGYPIGDLNWFPEEKSSWESDANKENYDDILGMIEDGTWDFESVGIFDKFLQGNQKESIIKVFPNPVSGNAQIEYELSKGSNVNLSVYNVLGSEILNITNEFKTTGTHVDIFNTSKFPVGTYIIKLQVNNTISLQKFTVVK